MIILSANLYLCKPIFNFQATFYNFSVIHIDADMYDVQKIITDCKKGKSYAQDWVFTNYAPVMLGTCMRYCSNKAEAEDVLQEAFIKVFSKMDKFENKNEGSLGGWIKRIVVNTALNYIRDNAKHNHFTDINDIHYSIADDNSSVDENQNMDVTPQQIMEIVQDLPPGYKMVFNLYVFEKYSHKEIAESLKISENTSKSQLFKARKIITEKVLMLKKTELCYE